MKNLIEAAKKHNEAIDTFINVTLKEHFGSDKLNVSQWFEAQNMISDQDFYEKGIIILDALRLEGIDAKIDMQSNKLLIPYRYIAE